MHKGYLSIDHFLPNIISACTIGCAIGYALVLQDKTPTKIYEKSAHAEIQSPFLFYSGILQQHEDNKKYRILPLNSAIEAQPPTEQAPRNTLMRTSQ